MFSVYLSRVVKLENEVYWLPDSQKATTIISIIAIQVYTLTSSEWEYSSYSTYLSAWGVTYLLILDIMTEVNLKNAWVLSWIHNFHKSLNDLSFINLNLYIMRTYRVIHVIIKWYILTKYALLQNFVFWRNGFRHTLSNYYNYLGKSISRLS